MTIMEHNLFDEFNERTTRVIVVPTLNNESYQICIKFIVSVITKTMQMPLTKQILTSLRRENNTLLLIIYSSTHYKSKLPIHMELNGAQTKSIASIRINQTELTLPLTSRNETAHGTTIKNPMIRYDAQVH